jgi:hypothetical protein
MVINLPLKSEMGLKTNQAAPLSMTWLAVLSTVLFFHELTSFLTHFLLKDTGGMCFQLVMISRNTCTVAFQFVKHRKIGLQTIVQQLGFAVAWKSLQDLCNSL